MELLLYRWSLAVQISSALLIALFFVVLARSVGRPELRPWVWAWLANLAALTVAIVFWWVQPAPPFAFVIACLFYVFSKTLFVALLIVGAGMFQRQQARPVPYRTLLAGIALFAIAGTLILRSIDMLGVFQATTVAICLAGGAILIGRNRTPAHGWLAIGFGVRAALAAAEALAYVFQASTGNGIASGHVASYLAAHSSFDTGAEWMIALGCVLTVYRTIQQELTATNSKLATARDELQALLDRDPLTGAFNRRALAAILRESQARGATILFFDLDDFKQINDSHGHHAGDECLKRFARALQESFRSGDHVIRYAGDEFVVLVSDPQPDEIADRIERVRGHLRFMPASGPQIGFSVGVATLPPDGDPEAALRAADEAMYRDKAA